MEQVVVVGMEIHGWLQTARRELTILAVETSSTGTTLIGLSELPSRVAVHSADVCLRSISARLDMI